MHVEKDVVVKNVYKLVKHELVITLIFSNISTTFNLLVILESYKIFKMFTSICRHIPHHDTFQGCWIFIVLGIMKVTYISFMLWFIHLFALRVNGEPNETKNHLQMFASLAWLALHHQNCPEFILISQKCDWLSIYTVQNKGDNSFLFLKRAIGGIIGEPYLLSFSNMGQVVLASM